MTTPVRSLLCLISLLAALGLAGCKSGTSVRMDTASSDFHAMPWPNDLRKKADGSLNLDGFPASAMNPLLKQIVDNGAGATRGFGLNSGALFQLTGSLDTLRLEDPRALASDTSPLQMVNIDPASAAYGRRYPVRVNYSALGTLFKPAHLLTVMPVAGYGLEPGATHAVLLFNGLRDTTGRALGRSTLLNDLVRHAPTVASAVRDQFQRVRQFLSTHSRWQAEQLVGYTVFTTQQPTTTALAVGRAVRAIDDDTVVARVTDLRVTGRCPGLVTLDGIVDVPRWQSGTSPYLTRGGGIALDNAGQPVQQGWESTPMAINIGCAAPPAQGRRVIVRADGTGAAYDAAHEVPSQFLTRSAFSGISISIAPLHSSERRSPRIDQLANLLASLGLSMKESDLEGFAYYNYLNPVAGVGNQIQGAADHVYLNRVASTLPRILAKFGITTAQTGLSSHDIGHHANGAGLIGQSQGATNSPLALAMDGSFRWAYLNGAASHAYPQALHRGTVRTLINTLMIGVMSNELDDFHPLMQVLQTFHEPADSSNYAALSSVKDLMITAGYHDGCVVREGAGGLGLAYARAGRLTLGATGTGMPFFSGIDHHVAAPVSEFPLVSGNLADGGTGLFLEIIAGHDAAGANQTVKAFIDRTVNGLNTAIPAPVIPSSWWECDSRYD